MKTCLRTLDAVQCILLAYSRPPGTWLIQKTPSCHQMAGGSNKSNLLWKLRHTKILLGETLAFLTANLHRYIFITYSSLKVCYQSYAQQERLQVLCFTVWGWELCLENRPEYYDSGGWETWGTKDHCVCFIFQRSFLTFYVTCYF